MSPNSGILLKGLFNPHLLNNPLASFYINLDFLLSYFDKIILNLLFVFISHGCLISVFLLHFKPYTIVVYI